jgi:serine/threonine protein kinase
MSLVSGATFAGFTIVRPLGSGAMGEVYLAQHPRLPRRDALKLLPHDVSTDSDFRERFNREADLASTLWHPHIVGVHDRGEWDGQLWISMDFVDGSDAARLMADRYPAGMPQGEVANIITAVASALDYANKQGLLHRDVKPANIMLTHLDDEGAQRILLTDFGIARNVDDITGLTATNMTLGTVAYSAPEQLMGETIDGRADQYALAATAYHLLTGSPLFPHSNPAVVISRHLNTTPPALVDTRPDLAALDPILSVALSKNPDDRFPRCSDFARVFADQLATPSAFSASPMAPTALAPVAYSWTATDTPPPIRRTAGRAVAGRGSRRKWAIPVAVVVAVLCAGIGLAWHPWDERHPNRDDLQQRPRPGAEHTSSTPQPPRPPGPAPVTPATITRFKINGGSHPDDGLTTAQNGQMMLPLVAWVL